MHRILSAGIIGILSIGAAHAVVAQEARRLAVARAAIDPAASAQATGAPLLDRPARLVVRNVSLSTGLRALQNASGVPVAYSSSLLPPDRRVSCACDSLTVGESLARLLAGTRLRFSEYGGQILIEVGPAPTTHSLTTLGNLRLASLGPPPVSMGGPAAVPSLWSHLTGMVVNGETGLPLPGAMIALLGSSDTVVSDAAGRFELMASGLTGHTLEARKPGYHARTESLPHGDAAVRLALDPALFGRRIGGITGQVTDAGTGQPVPSAQVLVEGTTFHAITQDNGRYLIQNVPNGIYAVVVKRVGYAEGRKANIKVTGDATVTVDFTLATRALTLEQVVVTGVTDPISGKKLPFSVGKISGQNVSAVPTTGSAATALQGKVAGVSVIRAGGQPGSGAYIQLRTPTGIEVGNNTGRSNSPLFVIDGIPMGSTLNGTTRDLATMDIESIEVIEGAAASSLYGARAANGVIQIRTKRGSGIPEGQTRFNVRTEIGINAAPQTYPLSTHNAYQVNAQGQWLDKDGNVTTNLDDRVLDGVGIMDNAYGSPLYNNVQAFFKPSQFMQTSVSVAQNSPSTNFFISAEDQENRGALVGNKGFWRRGVRLNLDHRVGSKLSLNTTAYHARTWQDDLSGSPFWDLLMYPPDVNLGLKDSLGKYKQTPDSTIPNENPLWRQTSRQNHNKSSRTQASANVRFSPLGWLTFTGMGSYDQANRQEQQYVPKGTPQGPNQTDPADGDLRLDNTIVDTYNASIGANLIHRFGNLTSRLNLQSSMEREQNRSTRVEGQNFAVAGVPQIDDATDQTGRSSFLDIRDNGYYAQAGFDYSGKYVGDFLVRRDGSSLFGPDVRWQTYYRGAGAWLLSAEPWWPLPALNLFKLRYAIGTAGQRPGFDNRYETWSVNGTRGTVSKNTLGNAVLKPGRKTEQEIGLDMIALDRFSLKLSYATQETKDQIINVVTPAATGYSTQVANAGTQKGTTYEATLEAELFNSPQVSWSTTFIADRSRSKITEFGRACYVDGMQKICPGSSLSDMWGFALVTSKDQLSTMGITSLDQFQINDDGWVVPVGTGNAYTDGIAKDLWGTNVVIDGTSYRWGMPVQVLDSIGLPLVQKIGSSQPDFNLGWLNNIRWHHLTLHTAMQAQLGGQVYNATKQRLYQHDRHGDLDQAGKPDGLKKPLEYYDNVVYNRNNITNAFVEPGWYVKLREVSLLYNLDSRQLSGIGLGWLKSDRVSIGVIGRNVLTFDNYSGYDPEVGSINNRRDYFGWPLSREFTGTIQIAF